MAQVKVIGMTDFRGLKSRKTGSDLNYIVLHCLVPNDGQRSFGYKASDVLVNDRQVPQGFNWSSLPCDFIIEQAFNSNTVIKCDPLGKSAS